MSRFTRSSDSSDFYDLYGRPDFSGTSACDATCDYCITSILSGTCKPHTNKACYHTKSLSSGYPGIKQSAYSSGYQSKYSPVASSGSFPVGSANSLCTMPKCVIGFSAGTIRPHANCKCTNKNNIHNPMNVHFEVPRVAYILRNPHEAREAHERDGIREAHDREVVRAEREYTARITREREVSAAREREVRAAREREVRAAREREVRNAREREVRNARVHNARVLDVHVRDASAAFNQLYLHDVTDLQASNGKCGNAKVTNGRRDTLTGVCFSCGHRGMIFTTGLCRQCS